MRRMTRMIARDSAGKMLVPLLGVLTVLAIGVAGVAIVLRMDEQQKRIAKEQELEQVLREKDELQSQFQELQQTKSRVEGELSRARQDLAQSLRHAPQVGERKFLGDESAPAVGPKAYLRHKSPPRRREVPFREYVIRSHI